MWSVSVPEAAGGAALGPVAPVVGEVRRPAGQHRGLEPEALEVPDLPGRAVVLVGRAPVEHVVVVDELHVTGQQLHRDVVGRVVGHAHDLAERLPLQVGQPGRLRVPLRRPDVGRDAAHEEAALPLGEHRHEVVRLAARRLLTPEVVGQLVVQRGGQVGALGGEQVVDAHRVGDRRQAAAAPVLEAHEPDEVGAVAVERQRRCRRARCPGRSGRRSPLVWSVTSPSTWPCLFCAHGSPRWVPIPQ